MSTRDPVQLDGEWLHEDRGYTDIPLLTGRQLAEQFPTVGLRLGDHRPRVRGKIREYLSPPGVRAH